MSPAMFSTSSTVSGLRQLMCNLSNRFIATGLNARYGYCVPPQYYSSSEQLSAHSRSLGYSVAFRYLWRREIVYDIETHYLLACRKFPWSWHV